MKRIAQIRKIIINGLLVVTNIIQLVFFSDIERIKYSLVTYFRKRSLTKYLIQIEFEYIFFVFSVCNWESYIVGVDLHYLLQLEVNHVPDLYPFWYQTRSKDGQDQRCKWTWLWCVHQLLVSHVYFIYVLMYCIFSQTPSLTYKPFLWFNDKILLSKFIEYAGTIWIKLYLTTLG